MIHKLKREVETILHQKPETRNSDILLWVEIVRHYYESPYREFCLLIRRATSLADTWLFLNAFMLEVPNQDNVKRIRADFNSKGKYMPTEWRVAKKRGLKQDEWKLALGYSVATPADHIELELQNQHFKSI